MINGIVGKVRFISASLEYRQVQKIFGNKRYITCIAAMDLCNSGLFCDERYTTVLRIPAIENGVMIILMTIMKKPMKTI